VTAIPIRFRLGPDLTPTDDGDLDDRIVWRLELTADGQPVPDMLWVFVDGLSLTRPGPFSEFAATSLQLCMPFSIELVTATLHLGPVFQRVPRYGLFRFESLWTAINTPYGESGAVETQSLDRWLVGTTFSAHRVTKTRRVRHKRFTDVYYSYYVRIRGSASAGCCRGILAEIFGQGEVTPVPLTDGSFSTTEPLRETTVYHATFSTEPAVLEDPWTCVPLLPGMRCGTITFGAFDATTWEVRVVKPKLTHRRIRNAGNG